ncbi:PREDICTED: 5-hydroxytryptamine receptor-like [Priapulus caudatus]|uniref:5-hydroxytryptamine receptor-like n=1 Tax=Priapulus caudatus TaxID=37621 RepID=A0ABM1F4P6_PRICU|nr:PREDICTED: 5-hydroxytryptamine receptor-like [Priapulus caudatus]
MAATVAMTTTSAYADYWDATSRLPAYLANASDGNGTVAANVTVTETYVTSAYGGGLVPAYGLVEFVFVSSILGILILMTIVGNVFVIAAIILEKNLQSVANHLILSLAVADLLVAALVMPLSAVYEVTKTWFLGRQICNMWTSLDVLCCTASILHLVIISLDRYWAITSIDYIHRRTPKRIGLMIVMVWVISAAISIAPLFGWRDPETAHASDTCLISQDIGYTFFSTFGAFYIPMVVMLSVYYKIYRAAKSRIRKKPGGRAKMQLPPPSTVGAVQTEATTMTHLNNERKAAKTLAIITGSFLLCWLPFFILEVVKPFCHDCFQGLDAMVSVLLWLGYFNSLLNPVIYTIFSPDFRNAFHKILLGRYRKKYYPH